MLSSSFLSYNSSSQYDLFKEEARRQSNVENETKIENAQLKSEHVAATDKVQQLQKEILRIENEKKDNVSKIQVTDYVAYLLVHSLAILSCSSLQDKNIYKLIQKLFQ